MFPIPEFYKNRSIFLTGGTGFVGKALVEKLLRTCPELKNVYILIRPKPTQTVSQRCELMLKNKIFSRVNSSQLSKVVPIAGDINLPGLGISDADLVEVLIPNVSIVIHSAATLKFNERLDIALNTNVRGSLRILELAKKCEKLDSIVYVSTAYVNSDLDSESRVEEKIYNKDSDPEDLEEFMEYVDSLSRDQLEMMTPKLLRGKPNSYTFTKYLAEKVMEQNKKILSISIVRPSIVIGAWKDPLPGWVEGFTGYNAVVAAIGAGAVKIFQIDVVSFFLCCLELLITNPVLQHHYVLRSNCHLNNLD